MENDKPKKVAPSLRSDDAEVHIGETRVRGRYKAYVLGYLPNGSSQRWVEAGGGSTKANPLDLPHQRNGFDSAYEAAQFALSLFPTREKFIELLQAHTGHQNLASSSGAPSLERLPMPWEADNAELLSLEEPHRKASE